MNIITLTEPDFEKLVDSIIKKLNHTSAPPQDRWINQEEAMRLLIISSRTTLQKLRDEGRVRFSTPISPKTKLYDRESIMALIDKHVKEPFNER